MGNSYTSRLLFNMSVLRILFGWAAVCLVVFASDQGGLLARDMSGASTTRQPNVILINLDDADYRMFSPELVKLYPSISKLAQRSVSFTNLHVTTPFCGPSRAALFRGQYAHRTGVRVNIPESPMSLGFKGGYREFLRQQHDEDELGVWMRQVGYRTMMIGKYHHNGFDFKKPPGWDDFYMSNGGRYQGTYRFTTKDQPNGSHSRNPIEVYRTDQEADDAVRLIREHTGGSKGQPFFLYLAPLAPHRPVGRDFSKMVDEKRYGQWHPELRIPSTPEFDEAQMSDKPPHRRSPPYTESELETLHAEYLCRARAVKSVDDMVGRVLHVLDECDITDSTYILFTSDNGYQLGQHRLQHKLDPYQMCTNVPLFVSGPGVAKGQLANHLLAHIDICPTILELAGAKIPDFVDGKSFATLIYQPDSIAESTWRDPVVIENWAAKINRGKVLPGMYSGLRFYDKVYVEWVTGDKEYYDYANDPFELNNVYGELSNDAQRELTTSLQSARRVKMAPLLTVVPGPVESAHRERFVVRGYAEADTRIKQIRLTIMDEAARKYWSGKSWETEPTELSAKPSSQDQQMVGWDYPVRTACHNRQESEGDLIVTAWAIDDRGNKSETYSVSWPVPPSPVSSGD